MSNTSALTENERKKLHFLGYTNAHLTEFSLETARAIIANRSFRPGSKAYLQNVAINPLTGTVGLDDAMIERISDEGIEARNATRPEPSGVEITRSEFTGQCLEMAGKPLVWNGEVISGSDPLNMELMRLEKKHPGFRFRWEHPRSPVTSGPKYQKYYDPDTGKELVNGELTMCFMTTEAWENGVNKPNLERGQKLTEAVKSNKSDQVKSDSESLDSGVLSTGKSEAFYA